MESSVKLAPWSAWIILFRERIPLPVYSLLAGGIALSAQMIQLGEIHSFALAVSFVGILAFLIELRLMDEFKDYPKDLIAHSDRPLPRKVLSPRQVEKMIYVVFVAMAGGAALLSLAKSTAGFIYAIVVLYLWLMFKNFYLGEWLAKKPILYAITHQAVMIPICLFSVALERASFIHHPPVWGWSVCLLGAFFSYEVCRKLDPKADPILETYLIAYGRSMTVGMVAILLGLAAYGAWIAELGRLLWPLEILLALFLSLIFLKPKAFKVVEAIAVLVLLLHLWAVPLAHALGMMV